MIVMCYGLVYGTAPGSVLLGSLVSLCSFRKCVLVTVFLLFCLYSLVCLCFFLLFAMAGISIWGYVGVVYKVDKDRSSSCIPFISFLVTNRGAKEVMMAVVVERC